jgi:uncharacterized membrane protein
MMTPIIILAILVFPLIIAYLVSKIKRTKLNKKKFSSWGLAFAFFFFSIGHFVKTAGMVEMLPPIIPFRMELIYATGILEFFIGVALLIPRFQHKASLVAIIVFIVFFPANIYSAINSIGLGGHQWGAIYLFIRLPLQVILIAWAYLLCFKKS